MTLLPPLVTLICNGVNFTKSTVLHGSKTGENNLGEHIRDRLQCLDIDFFSF